MALSYRINAVFVWKPVLLVLEFLVCVIRTGITINTGTFYANVLYSSRKKSSKEKKVCMQVRATAGCQCVRDNAKDKGSCRIKGST